MKTYFQSDTYYTSKNTPRALGDILSLNTRLYFLSRFFHIILSARSRCVKNRYSNEDWAESSYDVFKLTEACGGRFHLSGLNNLKKCRGPVVFISNHMSTLETMVFPCIIAPVMKVTFVVKESLVRHPFFGPIMRSRDPIVVSRSNSREDLLTVMNKGQILLAEKTSVVVFPQSTRRTDFLPQEFNSLGIKLALKANVQVVPVALKTDFWQTGKYLKDLGPLDRSQPIHIAFGEPMNVEGTGKDEHRKIIDFIRSHLEDWRLAFQP